MSNVEHFVLMRNIERFERALAEEADPTQRRVLTDLLAQAREKLAAIEAEPPPDPTSRPRIE